MLLPLPGKSRRCRVEEFPDLRCAQYLEKQYLRHGPCALRRTIRSLCQRRREHEETRARATSGSSSIREIATSEHQLETAERLAAISDLPIETEEEP